MNNLVYTSPLIAIFGLSPDDAETFKNVDDIVDSSSFYAELPCTLIKKQKVLLLLAVNAQESPAKLTERFLLTIVFGVCWVILTIRPERVGLVGVIGTVESK